MNSFCAISLNKWLKETSISEITTISIIIRMVGDDVQNIPYTQNCPVAGH
jgi:hypothetical protein